MEMESQNSGTECAGGTAEGKKSIGTMNLSHAVVENLLPQQSRQLPVPWVIERSDNCIQQSECMWKEFLMNGSRYENVAPVSIFKYAPLAEKWEIFAIPDLIIELPDPLLIKNPTQPVYWVGTIKGYAGYKALVTFYPVPNSFDIPELKQVLLTWIPFCSGIPKKLGYSFAHNITLYPPTQRWLETHVVTDITRQIFQEINFPLNKSSESVKMNHHEIVKAEFRKQASRFSIDEAVEVLNKLDVSGYRLGLIVARVGDRVLVKYFEEDNNDQGFWISQHSPYIHKLGWCEAVGITLCQLKPGCINYLNVTTYNLEDLKFPVTPSGIVIKEDMLFEMRHPIFPDIICTGYVVRVLKHGYLVAGTDWTKTSNYAEMVLHVTSDYILPLGFCQHNGIDFQPPSDAFASGGSSELNQRPFSWKAYLKKTSHQALDLSLISKKPNKFRRGHKLEVVKIRKPTLLRPATVTQVAGRLIQVYFDGKNKNVKWAYQWMSCESSNIYPLGYAEAVWHGTLGKGEVSDANEFRE